jgi:hypothetical protein
VTAPCDLLAAELALDRAEAELAAELPAHVRAFARAYADGRVPPPAPAWQRALVAATQALAHPLLEDRAIELLRYAAPLAIEDDLAVRAARARERSWPAYDALAAARDAASRARLGRRFLDAMHVLHGSRAAAGPSTWPAPIPAWHDRDLALELDEGALAELWHELATRHGARGQCTIVRADARPRVFVVEPGREVIAVISELATPAERFAAVHELGHALAALVIDRPLPRVVDEAAAAYVARVLEREGRWFSPLAGAARVRRLALARALAAVERGDGDRHGERPPWALWHDPGAQAAYVEAEEIADRWCAASITLADAIAAERARIDAATTL